MKIIKKILILTTFASNAFFLSACSNIKDLSSQTNDENFYNYLSSFVDVKKEDSLTNRNVNNENKNFDEILKIGNLFIENVNSNYEFKTIVLTQIIKNFISDYTNSRANKFNEYEIEQSQKNNILTLKINLVYNNDFTTSLLSSCRSKNDIDAFEIIFDLNASNFEPYINQISTNFLSFKIKPTKFIRSFFNSKTNKNEYTLIDNTIVFNTDNLEVEYNNTNYFFSLDFTNSFANINFEIFLKNSYLYNKSNNDEKNFYIEVISLLENKTKNFYLDIDNVNSWYPSSIKSQGIFCRKTLFNNKQISNIFLNQLATELKTIYNFCGTIKLLSSPLNINYIVIEPNCQTPFKTIDVQTNLENNYLIDLSTNKPYEKNFYDYLFPFEAYRELNEVRLNYFFNNNKDLLNFLNSENGYENNGFNLNISFEQIKNNYQDFLNKLSDEQKAKLIYFLLLPKVSYGQLKQNVNNILGIIDKKMLCEGYATTFCYLANIFQIPSIYIEGNVFVSDPNQTDIKGLHAWNAIYVNNSWLWCDPTWDDSLEANSLSYKFDNFLKTYKDFFSSKTHINITNWNNGADLVFIETTK